MPAERGLLGATFLPEGAVRLRAWAPSASVVEAVLAGGRRVRLGPADDLGVHEAVLPGMQAGDRYRLSLDGGEPLADPASRSQPEGVHGPSAVVDERFRWTDAGWRGIPHRSLVISEIHVGTRTRPGTFEALIPLLPRLKALGVTALELMPIAEFPGARNWGYDGVFPFAAQSTYGGLDGLRRLVDAAHGHGLAVILDVVYNHFGPEGGVAGRFGPFFTSRFRTPWGNAINFDDEHSDGVRDFFLDSARWWLEDCRVDGLRLDAVHEICDWSAHPFLADLSELAHAIEARQGRSLVLIAESDRNDRRLVEPRERNGLGLHAKWDEDFHHALHAAITGERWGYHAEYGEMHQVLTAWQDAYVFTGQRSALRKRRHGSSTAGLPGERFVCFIQNHDQVGNRPLGERLSALLPPGGLKLAAASVLLSPFMPLLFMGEEHGETTPFPYFTSHSDPELVEAVRRGRRELTLPFGEHLEAPDPQAEATFLSAIVAAAPEPGSPGERHWEWHRELLRLRRETLAFSGGRAGLTAWLSGERTLVVRRSAAGSDSVLVLHHDAVPSVLPALPHAAMPWRRQLDSEEERWGGSGRESLVTIPDPDTPLPLAPWAVLLYVTP